MALIKCPKCNKAISDTTKKCIHCKTKIKSNNNTLKINYKLVIPISIIILFLIVSFIAYKIDDNKIHYNDKKQDIEEVQTNDENNLNNNQENTSSTDNIDNNSNSNSEKEENKNTTTNNNNGTNNNTTSNNNNTSTNNNTTNNSNNNSNTNNKIVIDATKNESCPVGYNKEDISGSPCKKIDIVNGTITYYCLLDTHILVGDKCKSVYTSKPVGGQCYNDAVLNNGICETITYTNASTRLTCPTGYTKYSDTQCYNWLYEETIITYSCPSGYTLNGNKCEK